MNLEKLFETQRRLDERIIEEKGLHGQDLLDKKILALQVELGELCNCWRGFKFWSNDQEPRTTAKCEMCDGLGNDIYFTGSYDNGTLQECSEPCEYCDGTGDDDSKNPLLEEYVDCLHFILSIGNDIGIDLDKHKRFIIPKKMLTILDQFMWTNHKINELYRVYRDEGRKYMSYEYVHAFNAILGLGAMLGFTPEQIESAYYEKNAENHRRQEVGY